MREPNPLRLLDDPALGPALRAEIEHTRSATSLAELRSQVLSAAEAGAVPNRGVSLASKGSILGLGGGALLAALLIGVLWSPVVEPPENETNAVTQDGDANPPHAFADGATLEARSAGPQPTARVPPDAGASAERPALLDRPTRSERGGDPRGSERGGDPRSTRPRTNRARRPAPVSDTARGLGRSPTTGGRPQEEDLAKPGGLNRGEGPIAIGTLRTTVPDDLAADLSEYDNARRALESGDLDKAVERLTRYLERRPLGRLRLEAKLNLVEAFVLQERHEKAVDLAEDLLEAREAEARHDELRAVIVTGLSILGDCRRAQRFLSSRSHPALLEAVKKCEDGGG